MASFDDVPPLVSTVVDGVTHTLWALTDPEALDAVAADLAPRAAVIADGHHRYATYLRHQADRHAAGDGAGPWDRGLALLKSGDMPKARESFLSATQPSAPAEPEYTA